MTNYSLLGTVMLAHLLALISPGPDFFMCVRNSLRYSRTAGIWTAVGFGGGIAIHILLSWAGLALLLSQSPRWYGALKILGAGYLIYVGFKSWTANGGLSVAGDLSNSSIRPILALQAGFLTNVLNPKATLFFLSLFTFVVDPSTPSNTFSLICVFLVGSTILWFSMVAVFITHAPIRQQIERNYKYVMKGIGLVFVALGIRLLWG